MVSLAIGYAFGSHQSPNELITEVKKKIQLAKEPSGGINRPDPDTVNRWQDKDQLEQDEQFKAEFLKAHPEFQKTINAYEQQNRKIT